MTAELVRQYLAFYRDLGFKEVRLRPAPAAGPAIEEAPRKIPEAVQTPPVTPVARERREDPPVASRPIPATVSVPAPVMDTLSLPPLAPEGDSMAAIRNDIGDCKRCRLCEKRNKIVFGSGNEGSALVFVGEGPGADEDAQGLPFVGRAGQLLTQMIEGTASKEGIPIQRPDVYICNVVKCRPPENRTPQPDEMEICGQFLFRQLQVIRPKAICCLGSTAAKALLGTRDGVMKLRGNWQRWHDIPVMVTYHPSYLLRPYNQNAKREAWEDLKKVLHFVYD
ncbi:MAG: uracil-DNA glycosylase family protein [Bryobacteraceae bacterium]